MKTNEKGLIYLELKIIARIHTDFPTKFGLPRQSGRAEGLRGRIVFEKEYAFKEALRGIEGFSHLWLIWGFSQNEEGKWSPTVRPPRLGGNKRLGVFATRSPFRPNPIGLSCVRLIDVDLCGDIPALTVDGIDMADGTPIYDIKPYLPGADRIRDAVGGFADSHVNDSVEVIFPDELLRLIPEELTGGLIAALRDDPRPSYHSDPDRVYGFAYSLYDIRFKVRDGVLTVVEIAEQADV